MKDYVIYTDASADVDSDFLNANGVKTVPMEYMLDGEPQSCYGNDAEKYKEFYGKLRRGSNATTSQITPFIYEETFSPLLEKGVSVLYISLSSGLSSTFQSACTAAKTLKEKYPDADLIPVDSLFATGGMGLLCERAVRNKGNGLSAAENASDLALLRKDKLAGVCFVDNLNHLRKGGRISAATAVFGTILNIKPLIAITDDGTLKNFGKCQGERRALKELADIYKKNADFSADYSVYICDSDNPKGSEALAQSIKAINPDAVIKKVFLTPIIGTHLGPDSVVLCYVKKQS